MGKNEGGQDEQSGPRGEDRRKGREEVPFHWSSAMMFDRSDW